MPHGGSLRQGHAYAGCVRGHLARSHHASIGTTVPADSTPLVLLVGQVERAARGREAGQEIDTPTSSAAWPNG